jgi:hypothetical protein
VTWSKIIESPREGRRAAWSGSDPHMNANHPPQSHRRGVLLLVVLSLLTLFLLLGTAYLVASSRARVTARAFNRLVMHSEEARVPTTRHLDQVLRYALRGTSTTVSLAAPAPASPLTVKFESLLEDSYGRPVPLTGTAQTVSLPAGTPAGKKSPLLVLGNVTVSGSPMLKAAELPGRVLTLLPPDGRPTSHRIIHAAGTPPNLEIHVDWPTTAAAFRVPTGSCPILINGREFDGRHANEAWDGFDTDNAFLAHVEPDPSTVSRANVLRFSYLDQAAPPGSPLMADNDNDGAKDGVFLDFGLPGVQTSAGTIDVHASVLIVDLDSRFNVNAHGSYAGRIYPSSAPDWPSIPGTGPSLADAPLGSGYGPPEVNADWMFPHTSGGYPANRAGARDASWLLSGSMAGSSVLGTPPAQSVLRPTGSRFTVGSQTPLLQSTQGRYGERVGAPSASFRLKDASPSTPASAGDALPGRAAVDDVLSQINDQRQPPHYHQQTWAVKTSASDGVPVEWWDAGANYDYRNTRTSFNSPPDLHGRMKTLARPPAGSGIAPRLFYAKAEWGNETQDDPYELQLGSTAARNGWLADPSTSGFLPVFDSIFTFAELEPVLRPYDNDAFQLPLRLSATLGPLAEEARLRVTTDSWDTTAITGKAAANIAQWINACAGNFAPATSPIDGSLAGEVARGECFDLNRPLTNDKPPAYAPLHPYYLQRQAYFKDLYTLICAVLHPIAAPSVDQAKEYAQWAANVVEFRDADSTMTPFEYDANLLDGWSPDGDATSPEATDLIWGAERPELLIMQTSAWEDDQTGELFIVLHRPWNAAALSNSASIPAEPVDTALDVHNGLPQNVVDLGRKASDEAADQTSKYPIWRLRVEAANGGSALIRLDAADVTATEYNSSLVTDQTTTPKMGVDSWLCIRGTNTIPAMIPATIPGTFTDLVIDRGGPFRVPGQLPTTDGPPRTAWVYLERLTDPAAKAGVAQAWGAPPGSSSPPHYHVVDRAPIEVVNRIIPPAQQQAPAPSSISRDIATQGSALWKCVAATALGVPAPTIQLGPPAFPSGTSAAKWLPWPNRPFVSAAELFLVPGANAIDISPSANAVAMLMAYAAPEPNTNWFRDFHVQAGQTQLLLLDAIRVPTRFAGIHRTITTDPGNSLANAGIFHVTTPVNQLSAYREPGRVNLNTVTSDDVWNAVVAGSLSKPPSNPGPDPLKTRQAAKFAASPASPASPGVPGVPAKSLGDVLALGGSGGTLLNVATDTNAALSGDNPAHRLYTANRLANTATIRSNVFAVWITLRESIAGNPDSIKYHRAFYIVDRSIPVAFEPGKDHNTWDTVVVRRIIE